MGIVAAERRTNSNHTAEAVDVSRVDLYREANGQFH